MNWRVVLEPDYNLCSWSAWCPELPVASQGITKEEAIKNIKEAIQLHLTLDEIDLSTYPKGTHIVKVEV